MILECPSCHARFMVADALVPPAGRTVRCGKCTHAWFVEGVKLNATDDTPTADAPPMEEEISIKPLIRGSNLPVVRRRKLSAKPFMLAAPALAALWLVLAFITYAPTWSEVPGLSAIYHMLGAKPIDGLVFDDVHMEREQEGSKTKFILTGSIRNHASAERSVPTVRVALKDKANKTIWGREYPVNTTLAAGEVYPFRITNVETSFAGSVSSIVVDMGNSLQLLVR